MVVLVAVPTGGKILWRAEKLQSKIPRIAQIPEAANSLCLKKSRLWQTGPPWLVIALRASVSSAFSSPHIGSRFLDSSMLHSSNAAKGLAGQRGN